MHKLATELNQIIQNENPHVFEMLSDLGKQMYFPTEGILSQSAEAKNKAFKFNATDRKSTRLNSSHWNKSRMPSSA